jgi:flavorubredoxin
MTDHHLLQEEVTSRAIQASAREVAPGLHWIGGCLAIHYKGTIIHSYLSPYLIIGTEHTLMVDTGAAGQWEVVGPRVAEVLGDRQLDYVFPTHPELPHIGSLNRVLEAHPSCRVVGDVRDQHLFFPDHVDRLVPMGVGDAIDLGDRRFVFVEAIIRDLCTTLWGFDEGSRALFVADGFGFYHVHEPTQCGQIAEELPGEITVDQATFLNDAALFWVRYTDLRPILTRVDALVAELEPRIIAPAHGAVITDVDTTFTFLRDKVLEGQASTGMNFSRRM